MSQKNTATCLKASERRLSPRYSLRFEILVVSQNQSLRSRTINLSMSGALMEDPIPKNFQNGPVEVVIIVPHLKNEQKTYLNFHGLVVGSGEPSPRLTFLRDKDESFNKLQKMISKAEELVEI